MEFDVYILSTTNKLSKHNTIKTYCRDAISLEFVKNNNKGGHTLLY